MIIRGSFLSATALAIGCGGPAPIAAPPAPSSTAPPAPSQAASPPDLEDSEPDFDLKAAIAREQTASLPQYQVQPAGVVWKMTTASTQPPAVKRDGDTTVVEVSLGTAVPVTCRVHQQPVDVGGTLANALNLNPDLADATVDVVDVVAAGDVPVITANGLGVVERDGKTVARELTVAIAAHHAWAIVCEHGEVGYRQTLTRAVKLMAQSIRFETHKPSKYVALYIMRAGGRPVGFERLTYGVGIGQQLVINEVGTVAIAGSKSQRNFFDYLTFQRVDKNGRLQAGSWVGALNGEMSVNLKVTHQKAGRHAVIGKARDDSVDATFTTPDRRAIPGLLLERKLIKGKLKAGKTVKLRVYNPVEHPGGLTAMAAKVSSDEPLTYSTQQKESAPISSKVVDTDGMTISAELTYADGSTMKVERVAVAGKP